MKIIVSLIPSLLVSAMLFACGPQQETDTSQRDSLGTVMSLSKWNSIPPSRIIINLSDLNPIKINKTESRIRDNSSVHQRIYIGNRGYIFISHILEPYGRYNIRVTTDLNSLQNLKQSVSKYFGNRRFLFMDEIKVYSLNDRGGWITVAKAVESDIQCIFGRVGFLSTITKRKYDEVYDTIVRIRDCSGNLTLSDVKDFLTGVKIVDESYNRNLG